VVRDHTRQRHCQVVTEREVGRVSQRDVLQRVATLQDLENELIALFAVLPHEGFEILDGRRLERLEAVALVDTLDDPDDVFAAPHVFREEVAHAARWFCTRRHLGGQS
jgi:hypothetical protein